MRKLYISAFALGSLMALTACSGKSKEVVKETVVVINEVPAAAETPAPAAEPVPVPPPAPAPAPAPKPARAVDSGPIRLTGKVGGKYGVVMDIDLSRGYGSYYYTKMGPNAVLSLDVYYNPGTGSLSMTEYNDYGEVSGTWSGKINSTSYRGQMVNYKGTTYSFNLPVSFR